MNRLSVIQRIWCEKRLSYYPQLSVQTRILNIFTDWLCAGDRSPRRKPHSLNSLLASPKKGRATSEIPLSQSSIVFGMVPWKIFGHVPPTTVVFFLVSFFPFFLFYTCRGLNRTLIYDFNWVVKKIARPVINYVFISMKSGQKAEKKALKMIRNKRGHVATCDRWWMEGAQFQFKSYKTFSFQKMSIKNSFRKQFALL